VKVISRSTLSPPISRSPGASNALAFTHDGF
jgi:hypothetical protein